MPYLGLCCGLLYSCVYGRLVVRVYLSLLFFVLNHPVSFLVYPEVSLALVLSRKNGCQVVMPIHFRLEYVCSKCIYQLFFNAWDPKS